MPQAHGVSRVTPRVAIVHDYFAQGGGAERVVLAMSKAFPEAPIYTSIYRRRNAFPELQALDIRPNLLNRVPLFRRWHRLAFPFLAPAFSMMKIDASVVLVSSSGWAHAVPSRGPKVVYCHSPARWLYQPADRYLGTRRNARQAALRILRGPLMRWDARAAASATTYLANSTEVQQRIADCYGIDAMLVPAPHNLDPAGPRSPVADITPGYFLCVGRLVPYKNVHEVAAAFDLLPDHRLVIVGKGPLGRRLARRPRNNVVILDTLVDAQLRWLYANSRGLIAASYEDYGLTPLEAASFGRPTAAFRWGGFVDTVIPGITGVFFDEPTPAAIAEAVTAMASRSWNETAIQAHADDFSEDRFVERIREVVQAVSTSSPSG